MASASSQEGWRRRSLRLTRTSNRRWAREGGKQGHDAKIPDMAGIEAGNTRGALG